MADRELGYCVHTEADIAVQNTEIYRLNAEIERLRAWAEDEQRGRHKAEEDRMNARSEIEMLRAALKSFVAALDAGHAPPLEAYDQARNLLAAHEQSVPEASCQHDWQVFCPKCGARR